MDSLKCQTSTATPAEPGDLPLGLDTGGRPVLPWRIVQVQKRRNPLRCQAMTVSGLTMTSDERHSAQVWDSHAQRSRSVGFSFGRFTDRCSTLSWWRKARISSWSAARVRKDAKNVANKAAKMCEGRNRRKLGNCYFIKQIPISENHSLRQSSLFSLMMPPHRAGSCLESLRVVRPSGLRSLRQNLGCSGIN